IPSTGTPSDNNFGSHLGASGSYTELGPPDSTTPTGSSFISSPIDVVHGKMDENTCCSRIRRAINCVYCPPKSSTTTPPSSASILPTWSCTGFAVLAITPPPGLRVCPPRRYVLPRAFRRDAASRLVRLAPAEYPALPAFPPRLLISRAPAHSPVPRFPLPSRE